MANREPGFYWVKYDGYDAVAEFGHCGYWTITGSEYELVDSELEEIDERRIERPADPERVWYDHGEKK